MYLHTYINMYGINNGQSYAHFFSDFGDCISEDGYFIVKLCNDYFLQ
jgi:hypothetical protein